MWRKWFEFIFTLGLLVLLLTIPDRNEVAYPVIYYVTVIVLYGIVLVQIVRSRNSDLKFFYKWKRTRDYRFWYHFIREFSKAFLGVLIFGVFHAWVLHGRNPFEVIFIFYVALIMGVLAGTFSWQLNESKYIKIYESLKKEGYFDQSR
ncbi:hypothetical protein CEY16_07095 [Halalkalibacillus sediminis]|uniref:Uncharacterized protein n=1 Tax=Halalkalibacillus sediminis TaxID=2018042 RepID=A0A2I0QTM1_9BACI|nr:hypothetical protein CEY16_07095 [Halalkalibacillus sediminis]